MQIVNTAAVYRGRLMSPQEVKKSTIVKTEVPTSVRESWCLCGDVTEEFWSSLIDNSRNEKGFRLSAFTTPGDGWYVTFTVQVRDMQCRFLLSLSDSKAIQFIDETSKTGNIWLSLGRNNGHQAILQPFPMSAKDLQPISIIAHRCKILPAVNALIEFQLAAIEALEPMTVPSTLPAFNVRQVSLSILLPD